VAVHYTERAAVLPLQPGKKLVLMCVADSANADNRVGFPGFDALQKWSGLARSTVYKVLEQLVEDGWLARYGAGGRGKRAEFLVFPHGDCCPMHGPLPGYAERRPGDHSSGSSPVDPEEDGADGAETCAQTPVETVDTDPKAELQGPQQGPPQGGPLPSSPTRTTSRGSLTEVGAGPAVDSPPPSSPPAAGAAPLAETDPEPGSRCHVHLVYPATGPCQDCGDARLRHRAWEERQVQRRRAADAQERAAAAETRALTRAAVAACRLCTAHGRVTLEGVTVACQHDTARNLRAVRSRAEARRAAGLDQDPPDAEGPPAETATG